MSRPEPEPTILAGGGVVRRRAGGDGWEYAIVHRPRYDDWSLPKGKLDAGETSEEAALREVEEETGLRCALGPELSPVSYTDRRGRPKRVRYWLMEPSSGGGAGHEFHPNHEIDELRWCAAADASKLLTHEHDRALIAEAEAIN